ncbi:hypothetical protein [Streptomyces colonosanans]|uniref:Uncharacterized protein n=1 Tax=Streptomyces colonosanans TaxID=1428652 RepID=A0A1S2Q8N3_9ACTN|nr:hypothetical protein [Streptomyces colonosanans]OIK01595.1 hypothetical protein BIV24_00810 [Streptomyces colonosanans]
MTKVIEVAGALVSLFRFMQTLHQVADAEGTSTTAYNTSQLPDQLKSLEQGVRAFLLQAGAALDD